MISKLDVTPEPPVLPLSFEDRWHLCYKVKGMLRYKFTFMAGQSEKAKYYEFQYFSGTMKTRLAFQCFHNPAIYLHFMDIFDINKEDRTITISFCSDDLDWSSRELPPLHEVLNFPVTSEKN